MTLPDLLKYFDGYKKITKTVSDATAIATFLKDTFKSLYTAKDIADLVKGVGTAVIDLKVMPISSILELKTSLDELTMTESTINGGTGNDTIVSDGYAPRIFEYSQGDGNDVYYHFNENKTDKDSGLSTLDIKSGRIGHIAVIGNDVTFVVGTGSATGSLKLVDGANKKFKLVEDEEGGSVFTRAYGINYDTNEVVCSIFGSAADEYIQDNVGIKRDRTTYIGVNVEAKDTIIGETFANVIYGNGGNDNLRGNDKNDTIYGGNGDDIIDGNGGNDVLYGYDGTDEIYGGAGNDTIYSNEGDTVDGGTGDDYIRNSGDNASISAGDDNDTVENYGDKATIETGAGNDKIIHSGSNTKINAGDNNDTIKVHQNNTTVEAGNGNDSIQVGNITGSDSNVTFNIKVNAGANNDTVESYVSNVTIAGEVGDDLIILSADADRNFIDYKNGDGHDEIRGLTDDDTLKISSGNVSKITVENSDVILTVGEGSLRFKNFSNKEFKFTTADGEIFKCKLFADSVTKEVAGSIVSGKGQTTLYGTSSGDFLYGSNADDVIYGNDGNDNLYGEGGNDYIDGGWGNDFIYATLGNNTLIGGADNDKIIVGGSKNLIIHNYGDGSDTVGGLGGGTIRILGAGYTTLRASDKEGSIGYYDMIIEVGDYSDTAGQTVIKPISRIYVIENADGKNFKIEGDFAGELAPEGTYLDGDTLRFKQNYSGNTFDANNISLPIKNIDASLLNKGITVFGNGSIDLFTGSKFGDVYYCDMNSANSPAETFLMKEEFAEVLPTTIKAGGGNDTIYGGERENLYVYNAGDGDDVIYDVGAADALSISGSTYARSINDNDLIVKVGSGSVTFKNAATQTLNILGEEESKPAKPTWTLNGTTATYGDSITVTVIKSLEGVSLNNKTVTISNSALNQSTVTISDGYTLELADDVVKVSTTAAGWTKSGSTFTYTAVGTSAGYKLSGNKISYVAATGGDQFKITGLKDTSAVTVSGKKVTIGKNSLNQGTVTISDGYTLALGSDVATSAKQTAGSFTSFSNGTAKFKSNSFSDFYKLSGKTISYTPAASSKDITLTGLKKTLTLKNGTIAGITSSYSNGVTTFKIKAEDLTTGNVILTGDGKLQLDGYKKPANVAATFIKGVYTQAYTPAFYTATDKKITYTAKTGGDKFTITGLKSSTTPLKSNTGIKVDSKGVVTLSSSALDGKAVTLVNDTKDGVNKIAYKLAVDSSVSTKATTTKAAWTKKNSTFTYTAPITSAFYTLKGNTLNYTAKKGGDKFTITGLKSSATPLKSNTGIKVDSKGVVTLSSSALDGKAVTLVNDTKDGVNKIAYKLAVDSSISTKATTTKAAWTKKNSTFTYTAPITSAFYTLKGNTINYTAKKGGDKFTITGVKDTNVITVSGKKVTIGNTSLNGKAVTLTGDYTLALAKGVATSAKKTAGVFSTVSKGTATYKTTSFSGYYKLSGKKISYTAATGGQAITLKNLNTSANLAAVKKGITVTEQSNGSYKITFQNAGVLTTKAPTVSAAKGVKYTVAVADSLKPITKSAAWNINGTTAILRSTTTAGYTVSKNAIVYTAQKNGSPLVELTNLAKNVKANSITTKGKVITLNASDLGAKTAIKSNSGGYLFSLTGNASGKKFTGTSKVDTLTVAASNANVDAGAGNDVVTVSGLKVTLNGGAGNDQLTGGKNADWIYGGAGNDSILGNAGNDNLFGDAGNDSLRGGAGNDTLRGGKGDDHLWGDAGNDTFIYANGDSKDVIHGFESGDLLQITGTFSASYNGSKKEIAFKVGSTANAITLTDFGKTTIFHVNNDTYQLQNNTLTKK